MTEREEFEKDAKFLDSWVYGIEYHESPEHNAIRRVVAFGRRQHKRVRELEDTIQQLRENGVTFTETNEVVIPTNERVYHENCQAYRPEECDPSKGEVPCADCDLWDLVERKSAVVEAEPGGASV